MRDIEMTSKNRKPHTSNGVKILICTGIFPPESGGPATYSRTLMRELKKKGHRVSVITYSDFSSTDADEGIVRIQRSKFKPWHYFRYFLAARKLAKNADLVYAQDPVSSGYPAYLAAKGLKKPFAVKITGDYSWEQAQNRKLTRKLIDDFQNLSFYPGPIKRIRGIQIHVAKSADVVITPSDYLKKLVMGWGVKEKRIGVVYNAAALPQFTQSKAEARMELGVSADRFLIISAGRKVSWKGFGLLQEAVFELRSKLPNLELKIFHDLPRETLNQYYRAGDLFVLNTGYEGLSHTLLEVMAAETPIITTNVCGNPEVVADGENGLLVEYNNKEKLKAAIVKLYNDQSLRQKFAENGKKTLDKFTLEKMIGQTEKILKGLIP